MTRTKDNTPSSGRNGKQPAKLFTLGSPAKKTSSAQSTAAAPNPATNLLGSGSASPATKKPSDRANASSVNANLPVPKLPRKTYRAEAALKRLKIKPEQLTTAPQITNLFRNAEGGLKAVLTAMRFWAQDDVIAAFLKKYDAIPLGDRTRVPWEAIGIAAKVDLRTLSGAIMNAVVQSCGNTSKILAVTGHPSLMRATLKYGRMASGEKDRRAVDVMVGALPSPKGPTFINKAVFGAPGAKDGEEGESAAFFGKDDDLDQLFPSASTMQEKLISIRQRRLES